MISATLGVLGRVSVLTVWGMRTYVVFNRSRIVLVLLGSIGVACVILNIIGSIVAQCHWRDTIPIYDQLLSILMCAFEVLTTMLTTTRSIQALNVGGPWKNQKNGLFYLILEQGILYFATVSGFTVTALVLNYKAPVVQRLLNAYAMPISCLLTARFLLHLRGWEHKNSLASKHVLSGKIATIRFESRRTLSEFGEDPVLRAEREHDIEQLATTTESEGESSLVLSVVLTIESEGESSPVLSVV